MADAAPPPLPSIASAAWLRTPRTQRVFQALNARGNRARAVGGCVRNSIFEALGSGPATTAKDITDIDIATTATPEETIRCAAAAGLRTVPTGLPHGTVTVIADDIPYEVTTLRRDVATDGRHADVAFTDDWALDAARRDLTMNALYADADGTVFDPIGGYPDLYARRVRFVGDPLVRIHEDYLRILRFFRFFAEYGHGAPDAAGLAASVRARAGLSTLSAERVRQEILKLLAAPRASETCRIMFDHGLLTALLPVAPNLSRLTRLIADDEPPDPALRLAVLTVHVADDAPRLAGRLRLSRDEARLADLVSSAIKSGPATIPTPEAARRLLYLHGAETYQRLIKLDRSLSDQPSPSNDWPKLLALPEHWRPPAFPVDGNDLIALGLTAGPELGELIDHLRNKWIASDFSRSRDDLLADARNIMMNKSAN